VAWGSTNGEVWVNLMVNGHHHFIHPFNCIVKFDKLLLVIKGLSSVESVEGVK